MPLLSHHQKKNNPKPATTYEENDSTKLMSTPSAEEESEDGGTQLMSTPSAEEDGGTCVMSDPLADEESEDGGTQLMSTPSAEEESEEGGTQLMSDPLADEDGGTRVMSTPSAEEESEEGGTRLMSDPLADEESEEGGTRLMSEQIVDEKSENGGTPAVADDYQPTIASPRFITQTDDNEATIAKPLPDTSQPVSRPITQPAATIVKPSDKTAPLSAKSGSTSSGIIKTGVVLQKRYELTKILGKGGFGAAYLAQDIRLKRDCVVKQMLIPKGTSPKDIKAHHANFEQEASLLVQLNQPGHPNIPEIYDYFSDNTGSYLVMKYIAGKNLNDIIKEAGVSSEVSLENKKASPATSSQNIVMHISWQEAVRYIVAVCDALDYMHKHGSKPVTHRDVKPANILLGNDGRVWLVDFGLAKTDSSATSITDAGGSVGYTPLEQWLGEATAASDIYALGATLHHLVTGRNPSKVYQGQLTIAKIQEAHGKFPLIRTLDKTLPKELEQIVATATAATANERPTALQFKQQLEILTRGGQGAALFTFKNGESAKTEGELVDLCERYRSEAQNYLYHGDFERWFSLINRNDLASLATQAVKKYPTHQGHGLERFLKLVLPNIFWRRLWRAARRVAWWTTQFIIITLLVLMLLLAGISYGSRALLKLVIGGYDWNFYALTVDRPNSFSETYLTDTLQFLVGSDAKTIKVDVNLQPPNHVDIKAKSPDYQLTVPLALHLENQRPHLYFNETNTWLNYLLLDNFSLGLNEGIDDAFQKGPLDVKTLVVNDQEILFTVAESGRAVWVTPTPGPTVTPTPLPTPTATPTPEGQTLVVVYNDVGRDIILRINDETWNFRANEKLVIEKQPGTYTYTVIYRENGQFAAHGRKVWQAKAYRWHIEVATGKETPEPE